MSDAKQPEKKPGEEGRRSPRLQHEMLVSVLSPGKSSFSGWGTNLSVGGVFVNAPDAAVQAAKEGAGVDVLLQLPGQPECKLKGRIAWARPNGPGVAEPGMGVEFTSVDDASRELIGRMMARLAADLTGA
jgi:uncharacterized protein (TIGR02266 family)